MSFSKQMADLHKSRRDERQLHIKEFVSLFLISDLKAETPLSAVYKIYEKWTGGRGIYRFGIDGFAAALKTEEIEVGTIPHDNRRYLKGYGLK